MRGDIDILKLKRLSQLRIRVYACKHELYQDASIEANTISTLFIQILKKHCDLLHTCFEIHWDGLFIILL